MPAVSHPSRQSNDPRTAHLEILHQWSSEHSSDVQHLDSSINYDTEADCHIPSEKESLHEARDVFSAPGKRVPFIALVPGLCIFVLLAGLATAFVIWLLVHPVRGLTGESQSSLSTGYILVDEGSKVVDGRPESTLLGLIFTSVTTSIMGLTVAPVAGTLAYPIASDWLKGQSKGMTGPSPAQYQLLMRVMGAANFKALFESARHLYRPPRKQNHRSLLKAVILVGVLFVLSNLLSAIDLWLHATTHAVSVTLTIDVSPSVASSNPSALNPLFGTSINRTLCTSTGVRNGYPEGCQAGDRQNFYAGSLQGAYEAMGNISVDNSFAQLPDQLTIIVPTTIDDTEVFIAPTYGVQSSCQDITNLCTWLNLAQFDCGSAGYPGLVSTNFTGNYSGVLTDDTVTLRSVQYPHNVTGYLGSAENPFLVSSSSSLWVTSPGTPMYNDTRMYRSTFDHIYISACNLTMVHLNVTFANGAYTAINSSIQKTDFNDTLDLTTAFAQAFPPTALRAALQPYMFYLSPDEFAVKYGQELARLVLAFSTTVTQRVPAQITGGIVPKIVSKYPLAPVIIFLALLYLYSILVLLISIWTACLTSESTTIGWKEKNGTPKGDERITVRHSRPDIPSELETLREYLVSPQPIVDDYFSSHLHGKEVEDEPTTGTAGGVSSSTGGYTQTAGLLAGVRKRAAGGAPKFGIWPE